MELNRFVSLNRTTGWLAIVFIVLTVAAITPQEPVQAGDHPLASLSLHKAVTCTGPETGLERPCGAVGPVMVD